MTRIDSLPPLPVDAILAEIVASLGRTPNLVIEAPPGAGKTTRIPRALLDTVAGEILVLEPRRIAARLAARRVAWELSEEAGETVGYQVRFEKVAGPRTRLHFVTEGVLTRRLLSDPTLKGVDVVLLDEFHERHLDSDLALALLKRLQRSRPGLRIGLRIVAMSATLNAAPIAQYLGDCPVLRSEGRQFPLSIQHLPHSPEPLHVQVRLALQLLLQERQEGNILVFLPGVAEIRRAQRECGAAARAAGLVVLPLHGDLSPAEQDQAVAPAAQRKLILATNVAESSVTIEGVTAVIDSGLARIASHSHWTGMPTLHIGRVSQASAQQRAGQDAPAMVRSDLAQLCLSLRAMGISHLADLEWLDAPPGPAIEQAESLLDRLGATGEVARDLARYPLPPRLARMLVEAMRRGVGDFGCRAAALLGSGGRSQQSDLLAAIEAPLDEGAGHHLRQLLNLARARKRQDFVLDERATQQVGKTASRLDLLNPDQQGHADDEALLQAVLAGFPDRVGRRKAGGQVLLSNGVSAEFVGAPPSYEFMVALDAEDRTENPMPLIRLTARIEPEWLIDLFPEHVREESGAVWNRQAERVDAVSRMLYDQLILQESSNVAPERDAAAALLAEKALEAGIERFIDAELLGEWLGRIEFAGLPEPEISAALEELCMGLRSFAELKKAGKDFFVFLEQKIDGHRLRTVAPLTLKLQGGRQTKVHYERGKTPWIGSRLQDFFGMKETPRIGPEQTPVVVHLLAPNHRAVQMTTDLGGFWVRLYPQVRRELMRRYPRHQWPENPQS